jgi:hypothetical protein
VISIVGQITLTSYTPKGLQPNLFTSQIAGSINTEASHRRADAISNQACSLEGILGFN